MRRAIAAARPPEIIDGVSALILADVCDHFREFMIERGELNQPWSATPAVSGALWYRTEGPARMQI